MNAQINIKASPFHCKETLSQVQAVACVAVYKYAAAKGRAYKTDWLNTQSDFSFDKKLAASVVRHYVGELRAVGEYIAREGWRMGLTWNDAAANSRGGHNVKRDISRDEREVHRQAVEIARKTHGVFAGNTWSAQVAFLRDDEKGKAALDTAKAAIVAAEKAAKLAAAKAAKEKAEKEKAEKAAAKAAEKVITE
jgi:hypothetical protein